MPDADSAIYAMPQLNGVPKLIFHSIDDPLVPLSIARGYSPFASSITGARASRA